MTDKFLTDAARVLLGLEVTSRLPEIAAEALAADCDSPALRALASSDELPAQEGIAILNRALFELRLAIPTRRSAAMLLASETAKRMLSRDVSPYDGSKRIWEISRRVADEPVKELDPFIYAASEWEERPEERPFFEQAMLDAATVLAAKT